MKRLPYFFLFALGFALMDCRSTATVTDANELDGWHFHICSNETKAGRMWFEVSGTSGNSMYERHEIKWHSGQRTMVAVPEGMRFMDEINLSVRTGGKRKAKLCILYGQYVVKSIEVTGTEVNKLHRDNRDTCPC